jgi:D-alanyl-D-alanine carboxypeptidase (penicillin-binding protein 5/6)
MKYLGRKLVAIAAVVTIMMNTLAFGATKPTAVGESVLVIEQTTGSIVYSKNPDQKMYPASTTKMLTALVTLDYLGKDEIITAGEEIKNIPSDSSVAGIGIEETLTIETALNGLLLSSGNEVACMLALNVARKYTNQSDISYEEAQKVFAELMNKKAKELGAVHSNFVNPHGYHDDNHYTTATDLSMIAKAFLDNTLLASIASKDYFNGIGADRQKYPDKKIRTYSWKNSNLLLSSAAYKYEYATGVKTGSTDEAGKCLVASATKDGKKLLAVILKDSEAGRWQDAAGLFNYAFDNCDLTTLEKKDAPIGKVFIRDNSFIANNTIEVLADEDIKAFVNKDGGTITKEVKYYSTVATSAEGQPARLSLPLKKGQAIGKVSYRIDGELVYQTEVKIQEDVSIDLVNNDYTYAHDKMQKASVMKYLKIAVAVIIIGALICVVVGSIRKIITKRRRRTRLSMKRSRKNMYR